MQDEEKQFFERADAHIDLSNQQISEEVESEKVNDEKANYFISNTNCSFFIERLLYLSSFVLLNERKDARN